MTDTGSFATAPRACRDRYLYAEACLKQGMSYQASARVSGVSQSDLQQIVPGYATHRAPVPKPMLEPATLPPLAQAAQSLTMASPEECGQIAALALASLHERAGLNATRFAVANIMAGIPSLLPDDVIPPRRVIAREVAEYVAAQYGLTFADLCSARRTRAYARPRQLAMYAIKAMCGHMSYPAIGRLLGGRDHTTIMFGVRSIAALIQTDPDLAVVAAKVFDHFDDQVGAAA